jgi:hypothetical protein
MNAVHANSGLRLVLDVVGVDVPPVGAGVVVLPGVDAGGFGRNAFHESGWPYAEPSVPTGFRNAVQPNIEALVVAVVDGARSPTVGAGAWKNGGTNALHPNSEPLDVGVVGASVSAIAGEAVAIAPAPAAASTPPVKAAAVTSDFLPGFACLALLLCRAIVSLVPFQLAREPSGLILANQHLPVSNIIVSTIRPRFPSNLSVFFQIRMG